MKKKLLLIAFVVCVFIANSAQSQTTQFDQCKGDSFKCVQLDHSGLLRIQMKVMNEPDCELINATKARFYWFFYPEVHTIEAMHPGWHDLRLYDTLGVSLNWQNEVSNNIAYGDIRATMPVKIVSNGNQLYTFWLQLDPRQLALLEGIDALPGDIGTDKFHPYMLRIMN